MGSTSVPLQPFHTLDLGTFLSDLQAGVGMSGSVGPTSGAFSPLAGAAHVPRGSLGLRGGEVGPPCPAERALGSFPWGSRVFASQPDQSLVDTRGDQSTEQKSADLT